jgi:hypothetical protein
MCTVCWLSARDCKLLCAQFVGLVQEIVSFFVQSVHVK